MPLLHPQWPTVINVHLIPLGVPRRTRVLITLPRFLAPAAVWLVVVSSCRLATATTLLLLLWGGYVPSYFIDSQKKDGETGERLYVLEVEQQLCLGCSFLIIFKGPSWSLTGGVHDDEVCGDVGVGVTTSHVLAQGCHCPLVQVVGLLEAEAKPGEVPSDGERRRGLVNGSSPGRQATGYDHPALLLNDCLVSSRDCEQSHKIAAPTITVGGISETRGKVPLEDKSSEPPIARRLSELGIGLVSDPKEPMCHPTATETMDEVSPFGELISPAGSSPWQPILSVGGA